MYSEEKKEFLWKVFIKSGLSAEGTYLPKSIHPKHTKVHTRPQARQHCVDTVPHDKQLPAAGVTSLSPAPPPLPQEPCTDVKASMDEARMVMCGAVDELLGRTGMLPQDIDILITANSVFCPTPRCAPLARGAGRAPTHTHIHTLLAS